ncbi:Repressible alkaline phosphatase [Cladobotryum mycophilum]|uniref:Alkaline phosphatase n=1 Tax=Cladobotryum mycophilum TaxID=491253 RepID=A0ABR0SVS6_9HYPO
MYCLKLGSSVIAFGLLFGTISMADSEPLRAKNFIYVVPDGYGVASQVLARDYSSLIDGLSTKERPDSEKLGVDSMVIGTVRTHSSNSLITDSAAAATAFACGIKTYNGAVGVDNDGKPVGSILEAAHLSGYKTALVVTSRITHATPAGYSAHVFHRDSENEIASHQIGLTHPMGSVVDLLMGGGLQHYLPPSKGGKRTDGVDLIDWATKKGFTFVNQKSDFEQLSANGKTSLPFLGLFAHDHLAYEIDRDPAQEPSLLEMTKFALETLEATTADSEKGYFIMIEASRIDHAAHSNDAAAHLHDVLMYNKVMAYLREFITSHPDTQMLSAADHETGGLTLAHGYDPLVLKRARHSGQNLMAVFASYKGENRAQFLKERILPQYGILAATDDEVDVYLSLYDRVGASAMDRAIVTAFSAEAGLHWSTGEHTAADVLLHGFASGNQYDEMKRLIGFSQNNINLPRYIEMVLGVNMSDATAALRKEGANLTQQKRHQGRDLRCGQGACAGIFIESAGNIMSV